MAYNENIKGLPIPQIIINPIDPLTGSKSNNFIQVGRTEKPSNIPLSLANDDVKIGIQLKISEGDDLGWLDRKPMIFLHTLKNLYADNKIETSNSGNRITHIPNTPNGIIDGSGPRGQKVRIEPLNRTGTNYGGGHMRWNGTYSGSLVPTITSERDFTVSKEGGIQIVSLNGFKLGYSGLEIATFPLRLVEADGKYNNRFLRKRVGMYEPRVKIPLWFTFAYIGNDGRTVIESEYSKCLELYVYAQELDWDGNGLGRGDLYLIDWRARIKK